jgi:hypothetical protein
MFAYCMCNYDALYVFACVFVCHVLTDPWYVCSLCDVLCAFAGVFECRT